MSGSFIIFTIDIGYEKLFASVMLQYLIVKVLSCDRDQLHIITLWVPSRPDSPPVPMTKVVLLVPALEQPTCNFLHVFFLYFGLK